MKTVADIGTRYWIEDEQKHCLIDAKKCDLVAWFKRKGIRVSPRKTKSELFKIYKWHKKLNDFLRILR